MKVITSLNYSTTRIFNVNNTHILRRSEKIKSFQSLSLGMQKLLNGIRTYPIKYYKIQINF